MNFSIAGVKFKFFDIIIFLLLVFFAFVVFYNINATPLENWDESLYGEIAKQMILTHQFIVPYFNGLPYLDKPPLQMWIVAVLGSIFGLSEFLIRLPSAVCSFIIMVLVLKFSYKRWGMISAVFTFTTLAFNNIFMWRSRTGNLDVFSALFFVIIFFLILGRKKYKYPLLGFMFGLLYMTKLGLVLFPALIFVFDEITNLKFKVLKNFSNYLWLSLCAVVIPALWLVLGYIKIGQPFIQVYLYGASHGLIQSAAIKNFNTDYIMYAYYSLQRRFFPFLLLGLVCLLLNIKDRFNRTLFLFSSLLWIPLFFTPIKNNWYLVPLMPFWSLSIAYGIWQLLKWVSKLKVKYVYEVCAFLLVIFCLIIGYKTYTVNITPLYNNNATLKQMQTALKLKSITGLKDPIVWLDISYPASVYYSDRSIYIEPLMSQAQLSSLINDNTLFWVAGQKSDAENFIKMVKNKGYLIIPTNDEQEIVKFYSL